MFWSFWFHSGWAPIEWHFNDTHECSSLHLPDGNKQKLFSLQTKIWKIVTTWAYWLLLMIIICLSHVLNLPQWFQKARQSNITRYSSEFNTAVSSTWVSWGHLKKPNQSAELLRARTAAQHTDQQTPPAYWCHIYRWPVTTGVITAH